MSAFENLPDIKAEVIYRINGFGITNTMTSGIIVLLIIVILSIATTLLVKKGNTKPGKFQLLMEQLYEAIWGFIQSITNNEKVTNQIFPLIASVFFYIGISNILNLFPPFNFLVLPGTDIAMFRTHTNDLGTTLGMAIAMVFGAQLYSISKFNIFGHLGKFFKFGYVYSEFKKGIGAGFMSFIDFFIGLLDIISELSKVISLSVRLFGNMFTGDLLAFMLFSVAGLAFPVLLTFYGLFSGLIQALVFGALTASYYSLAVAEE